MELRQRDGVDCQDDRHCPGRRHRRIHAQARPAAAPRPIGRWRLERRVGGNRAGKCRAGKGRGKGLGGAEMGAGCGSGDAGFP